MRGDTNTLSYALTYGGTLALALLMLISQLTAAGILLALAGITRLTVCAVRAITRSANRHDTGHDNSPDTPPGRSSRS
jgi:hypothetical protein